MTSRPFTSLPASQSASNLHHTVIDKPNHHLSTMFHKQAGHMSRPPSPHHPHLSQVPFPIRTTITPTKSALQQQRQSSSPPNPPQQPYPVYPIPISSEKFPKALKLYNKYWYAKGLAQRVQEPQSAIGPDHLNIPLPARARSLTSHGSSRAYTPSVSNSAYDGVTESVVSFTGEESPGSATPNGSTELISYTGERVKQRIRRPLSPVTKAKAALIRHLGSCSICRGRRVPCPFEHHDIDSLEKARQAKDRTRQRAKSLQQSRSSNASSSNRTSGAVPADQPASGGSLGQMTSLLGVGGVGQADQFQDIPSSDSAQTDSQASTYATEADLLAEIASHRDVPGLANLTMPTMPLPNIDPYTGYQNGQMIALGVVRGGFFFCAHLDGLCHHPFADAEALQTHFETHFAYNRITPAHRYICSYCQNMNNFPSGSCSNCGMEGTIEMWIYGHFIRMPTYQHYKPDGQDFVWNNSSAPFYSSMGYGTGNMDFGFGGGMDNGNGNFTTGGMNQGGYYNFQDNNNFGDPSSQGDNGNGYNTPRSGGYPPFQGTWTRNRAKASPFTARHWFAKALQTYRHHKFLLLTLLLLVAFTLLFQAHEWLLVEVRKFTPISLLSHPNLPVFGFVGVLASFAMCYAYWSVKKLGVQRVRRAQCRPQKCPLHDLPTFSFHYRQTAPNTFVRGDVFS